MGFSCGALVGAYWGGAARFIVAWVPIRRSSGTLVGVQRQAEIGEPRMKELHQHEVGACGELLLEGAGRPVLGVGIGHDSHRCCIVSQRDGDLLPEALLDLPEIAVGEVEPRVGEREGKRRSESTRSGGWRRSGGGEYRGARWRRGRASEEMSSMSATCSISTSGRVSSPPVMTVTSIVCVANWEEETRSGRS